MSSSSLISQNYQNVAERNDILIQDLNIYEFDGKSDAFIIF